MTDSRSPKPSTRTADRPWLSSRAWRAGLLVLASCFSLESSVDRQPWVEIQAGPFRLVSDLKNEQALDLAERLRVFDRVTREVTNARNVRPRLPTLVLALSGPAYAGFKPPAGTRGVFYPGTRDNLMLLDTRRTPGTSAEGVLYHEYGHFVLHNEPELSYPTWYDEGLAEMLRSTEVKGDVVSYGDVLVDRLNTLRALGLLPCERVFSTRATGELDARETAIFYAQSWLLVLYMRFLGPLAPELGLPDRSQQLLRYLALYNQGVPPAQAFPQAFDASFEKLDAELKLFLRRGKLRPLVATRESLGFGSEPGLSPHVLAPADAAEVLGSAALRTGAFGVAQRLLARADALAPDRARVAFGLAQSRLGQGGDAKPIDALFERALGLAPDDLLGQVDYAEYLLTKAWAAAPQDAAAAGLARMVGTPPSDAESAELARRAAALLEGAVKREPGLADAHYLLGLAYERTGQSAERRRAALQTAYDLLPSNELFALRLARQLGAEGRFEEGRRIATRALVGSHDAELAQKIEQLLASWPARETPSVGATP